MENHYMLTRMNQLEADFASEKMRNSTIMDKVHRLEKDVRGLQIARSCTRVAIDEIRRLMGWRSKEKRKKILKEITP